MSDLGQLCCRESQRRQAVLDHPELNGIDYVEIRAATLDEQLFLHVHFLKAPPDGLADDPSAFRVEGGVRIRDIRVVGVEAEDDHLVVEVDKVGDFSTYELIVTADDLDPVFARCDFSFKAGCPSRFDCRPHRVCAEEPAAEPPIDYLAKDYASFRRALFDLAPTLVPGWRDDRAADLRTALVELLAYAGDRLSYHQDAVANEAYLETARQRISVRRHARLVDYRVHDGASARTFVCFDVASDGIIPAGTPVLTRVDTPLGNQRPPYGATISDEVEEAALAAAGAAFETLHEVRVYSDLGRIPIHTWGNEHCCLPRGATGADLVGDLAGHLEAGDFLLFEEVAGPGTGLAADAEPGHRQVVRLTEVETTVDPIGTPPSDLGADPTSLTLTRVAWAAADALTFPLCVSARLDVGPRHGEVEPEMSVARGNLALADHGRRVREEHAGPEAPRFPSLRRAHRLLLDEGPLSWRIPLAGSQPVAELLATDPHRAEPRVEVETDAGTDTWEPVPHLLDSRRFETHFTVETDNHGRALLRFGDGEHGLEPAEGSTVSAAYRVGAGTAGNVGAEALVHAVDHQAALADGESWPAIAGVRNPLAAWGGVDPEPLERVRRLAPEAFRAGAIRAVTEDDYARAAEKHPEVAKAVATFRWTGSWHTVFLTVDRWRGAEVDADFERRLRDFLERSRLAGYDLEIDAPIFVPLEIVIDVCVAPEHFRGHVEEALLRALGRHRLPDGTLGFFHPDHFTFGQPVYLSRLYAAAEAVAGVEGAHVSRFKRFHRPPAGELGRGFLPLGRCEIARLDNDPSRPENGVLRLEMRGGK